MKRTISLILLFVALGITASAQNAIDQSMERHSSSGQSKYTSIVKRDPQTHKVQTVVKKLELSGPNAQAFRELFNKEAQRRTISMEAANGITRILFAEKKEGQSRIYQLQYRGTLTTPYINQATVIIIVEFKN